MPDVDRARAAGDDSLIPFPWFTFDLNGNQKLQEEHVPLDFQTMRWVPQVRASVPGPMMVGFHCFPRRVQPNFFIAAKAKTTHL